jgi:hypothetical protein
MESYRCIRGQIDAQCKEIKDARVEYKENQGFCTCDEGMKMELMTGKTDMDESKNLYCKKEDGTPQGECPDGQLYYEYLKRCEDA